MKGSGIMSNENTDLFWEKLRIIDTRIMLNKLIRINLELFNEIRKYAYDNGVPLSFSPSILRLVDEIQKTDVECFPPNENLQHRKPNDKFTEPCPRLCKVFVGFPSL
jgi:hypothetical protein